MKIVSFEYINSLINKYHNIKLNPNFYYFEFSNKNSRSYSFSDRKTPFDNQLTVAFYGIRIFRINKNEIKLFPGLLHCLDVSYRKYSVTYENARKITYGETINIKVENGEYIIIDKFDRILGFGKVINSTFYPLINIGNYLHIEK